MSSPKAKPLARPTGIFPSAKTNAVPTLIPVEIAAPAESDFRLGGSGLSSQPLDGICV